MHFPVMWSVGRLSMEQRLQKILAQYGIASRRRSEELMRQGRVSLNGELASLGQRANPNVDRIEVDGKPLKAHACPKLVYILLHKPLNVVSTCDDPWGRQTVIDLLPPECQVAQGIHPVGRLDALSTGALLLSNDGAFTYCLTHPKHHVPKVYEVTVEGFPSEDTLRRWRRGVPLDGRPVLPAQVRVLQHYPNHRARLSIVLYEGRNRQIRRTAEQLGHPVTTLHRIAIGPIQLKNLRQGRSRLLNPAEVAKLRSCNVDNPSDLSHAVLD